MNEQYVLMLWLLAMLCSLVGGFDRLNSARRRESRSKIRGSKSNEKEIERKRERRKEGKRRNNFEFSSVQNSAVTKEYLQEFRLQVFEMRS